MEPNPFVEQRKAEIVIARQRKAHIKRIKVGVVTGAGVPIAGYAAKLYSKDPLTSSLIWGMVAAAAGVLHGPFGRHERNTAIGKAADAFATARNWVYTGHTAAAAEKILDAIEPKYLKLHVTTLGNAAQIIFTNSINTEPDQNGNAADKLEAAYWETISSSKRARRLLMHELQERPLPFEDAPEHVARVYKYFVEYAVKDPKIGMAAIDLAQQAAGAWDSPLVRSDLLIELAKICGEHAATLPRIESIGFTMPSDRSGNSATYIPISIQQNPEHLAWIGRANSLLDDAIHSLTALAVTDFDSQIRARELYASVISVSERLGELAETEIEPSSGSIGK